MLSCLRRYGVILSLGFALSTLTTHASTPKPYGVWSARINYSISGGGALADDLNLSINGTARLNFKLYGAVTRYHEESDEVVTGAFHHVQRIKKEQKCEEQGCSKVNFKSKKITRYKIPEGALNEADTSHLLPHGAMTIANLSCELWEADGVKKCLYQGVPLLVEYRAFGLYYRKQATSVTLDIKPEAIDFELPAYPLEKIALLKSSLKKGGMALPKSFPERLAKLAVAYHQSLKQHHLTEANLTQEERNLWLNRQGEHLFEESKKLLPAYLETMQKTRICLVQAQEWIAANECLEPFVDFKAKLTKERYPNIEQWRGEEREHLLEAFDAEIFRYQSKMKCLRSAKTITDLASCMK